MKEKELKDLMSNSGLSCVAMRHVANQIRDYFPDLSDVLDKAERQLMESILRMYDDEKLK